MAPISDELRTDRYIKINDSGLNGKLEYTPENKAAWRQGYFETDGEDYDGPLGKNPLVLWWKKRGLGKNNLGVLINQIDPRTAPVGTYGRTPVHSVNSCIRLLQGIHARYTELTGLPLILVPRYQNAQHMWWYELLSSELQELVKAITTFKMNTDRPLNKRALELLAPLIYLENQSVYDNFLETMCDNNNTMTKDSYVTTFLLAVGVQYKSIPAEHRVLPSVPAFVERIKERYSKCEAMPYLDILFSLQADVVKVARENMDIVEQYYIATHSNPHYAGFKQWMKKELGLDDFIVVCDVDHTDTSLKEQFGDPSSNNADELMHQFFLDGVQLLNRDDHMMKDRSKIARIVSGHIPNIGIDGKRLYSQRQLTQYIHAHQASIALYGSRCMWRSGLQRTQENEPLVDNHHGTGKKKKLTVIFLDGTTKTFDTDKIRPISAIVNESASSPESYEKDFGHEILIVRPGRRSYHQLFHYLLKHSALLHILGIELWYMDDGKFVVREDWKENPPSMVEKNMTTDESKRRLADFIKQNKPKRPRRPMSYFDGLYLKHQQKLQAGDTAIAAGDEDADDEETDASDDGNAATAVNPLVKTSRKRKRSSLSSNDDNGETQLRRSKRFKVDAKVQEEDDESFDEPYPTVSEASSTTANGQHSCTAAAQGNSSSQLATNTTTTTQSVSWIGQMSSQLQQIMATTQQEFTQQQQSYAAKLDNAQKQNEKLINQLQHEKKTGAEKDAEMSILQQQLKDEKRLSAEKDDKLAFMQQAIDQVKQQLENARLRKMIMEQKIENKHLAEELATEKEAIKHLKDTLLSLAA